MKFKKKTCLISQTTGRKTFQVEEAKAKELVLQEKYEEAFKVSAISKTSRCLHFSIME